MSTAIEAIKARSSTRSFKSEPISEQDLKTLLEAGLQAPTAANRKEIHFTVLSGDNPVLSEIEAERLGDRGLVKPQHNFYYEAPVVVILSADRSFRWSPLDSGIAVENMAIAAQDIGLGSLIIGCIYDAMRGEKRDYFADALKFPENYEFEIAIAFGKKSAEKQPHDYSAEEQITCI